LNKKEFSILLVDDDEVNLLIAPRLMEEQLECAVDVAHNCAEALQLSDQKEYHLILTDLQMPGQDGYYLANELRKKSDWRLKAMIIALSANSSTVELKERAMKAGIDGLLQKPLQIDALKQVLSQVKGKS
jgi:CheY-like chemotaxis protein